MSAVMLVPLVAACSSGTGPDGTGLAPVTSAPQEPVKPGLIAQQLGMTILAEPVPEVTGADNLEEAPTVAAGNGAPPTGNQLVAVNLVTGDGETATLASSVTVQYLGTLWDGGSEFDSTWGRGGEPAIFALTEVVPGFAAGIEGMKVGGRRLLVIPPDLGYGPAGNGESISGTDTLVFVVDLVAVDTASVMR
jgi:peptidylprolyl isomerase